MTINFTQYNRFFLTLSAILVAVSFVLFFTKGLNYGVDFKGGSSIYLQFQKPVEIEGIRKSLEGLGLKRAIVQRFGDAESNTYLVHVESIEVESAGFDEVLNKAFAGKAAITSLRFVEGEKAYFTIDKDLSEDEVRTVVGSISFEGHDIIRVERFGKETNREYLIIFKGISAKIESDLNAHFGTGMASVIKVEYVGPKVGQDLKLSAAGAVFFALLFIFLYIFLRFDFKYAPGAIICLFHDVCLTLGVLVATQLEFDLTVVAALLTLVGYSINDTIVVYDRVRENTLKFKGQPLAEVINRSLNQTLSRTLLTSLTTLLVTGVLCVLGGPVIYNFAFSLTIGIVFGTYSSIYIASPLTLWIDNMQAERKSAYRKAS